MKRYPGLREFVFNYASKYAGVTVRRGSIPPKLQIQDEDGVRVAEFDVTHFQLQDIQAKLREFGIFSSEEIQKDVVKVPCH
eukprot:JZ547967.1.p2 GENE.JZ547967.1~~JZ547967.1.p2  ORF type:complete len:81 (+),score=19.08 JZ547967.1:127-369(+)